MKMFAELEVHCHLFLTSACKTGERLVSHLPILSLGEVFRNQFDTRSGGPQGRSEGLAETTITHAGNRIQIPRLSNPQPSHYND